MGFDFFSSAGAHLKTTGEEFEWCHSIMVVNVAQVSSEEAGLPSLHDECPTYSICPIWLRCSDLPLYPSVHSGATDFSRSQSELLSWQTSFNILTLLIRMAIGSPGPDQHDRVSIYGCKKLC